MNGDPELPKIGKYPKNHEIKCVFFGFLNFKFINLFVLSGEQLSVKGNSAGKGRGNCVTLHCVALHYATLHYA